MAYTGSSIVDYLKSVGQDSSYAARKKLAAQYGITNYKGTAAQNTSLLHTLQAAAAESGATTTEPPTELEKIEAAKPGDYTPSAEVSSAEQDLKNWEANKPAAYESNYSTQIDDLLQQVLNRESFSYNMNADPLYQQYKDQYTSQGKAAMMSAMGDAAALSGGYGSSYATTAGNQAYQGYLQGLNDVIPELYSAAYSRYQDKGTEMYNQLGTLQGLDESDYSRYQDSVSNYYNDLNHYYTKYSDMSQADYNKYQNNISLWQNDRDFYYKKQQDALAQENWQKQYNLNL